MTTNTLPAGLVDQVAGLTPAQRAELVQVIDELDEQDVPPGPRSAEELRQLLIQRLEASHSGAIRGTTAQESIDRIRTKLLKHGIV
jgi:hypothetical protein